MQKPLRQLLTKNERLMDGKKTPVNTVFIASDMIYVTDKSNKWIVFKFAAPKYNCKPKDKYMKEWSCRPLGLKRAKHDSSKGHYDHKQDID